MRARRAFLPIAAAVLLVIARPIYADSLPVIADSGGDKCAAELPQPGHAVIVTVPRVDIFSDNPSTCSAVGSERCKARAYVVAGDVVELGKTCGPWTSATYVGKTKTTRGWIARKFIDSALELGRHGYEVIVLCDKSQRSATIVPYGGGFAGEKRCRFVDGTDVLVRWGKLSLRDTESNERYRTHLSVWVNRAKWVDKAVIDEDSGDEETYEPTSALWVPTSIEIGRRGMKTCQVPLLEEGNSVPSGSTVRCSTLTREQLPTVPDLIEFPQPGKERPAAGTRRLAYSRTPALCNSALAQLGDSESAAVPAGANLVGADKPALYRDSVEQKLDPAQAERFAMDNSGEPKLVFHYFESSQASESDTYKAFDKAEVKRFGSSARPVLVYPDDWEVCVRNGRTRPPAQGGQPCAPDESLLMPFSMRNADNEEVRFSDPSMVPFRFAGSTYFLLSTHVEDQSNVQFIVKPLPQRHYELTCSLELVKPYL